MAQNGQTHFKNLAANAGTLSLRIKWGKVFKNGRSKIRERKPLKSLKGYGL